MTSCRLLLAICQGNIYLMHILRINRHDIGLLLQSNEAHPFPCKGRKNSIGYVTILRHWEELNIHYADEKWQPRTCTLSALVYLQSVFSLSTNDCLQMRLNNSECCRPGPKLSTVSPIIELVDVLTRLQLARTIL